MLSKDELIEFLKEPRKMAIIGASTKSEKAGNYVPAFLQNRGWKIFPINPFADEILGEETTDDIEELTASVDGVIIYRNSEAATKESKKAINKGIPLVWLPEEVTSDEAKSFAEENNVKYIEDKCPKKLIENYIKEGIFEN